MTIAKVQSTVAGVSATPINITLSGVGHGHSLIVAINIQGSTSTSVTGITDTEGNTWTNLFATPQNTNYHFQDSEIWWVQNAAGGNTTLTIAFSGTAYAGNATAWIGEYSGINSVDVAAAVVTGTSTAPSATSPSASVTGDLALMFGITSNFGNAGTLPSSPWTNETQINQFYTTWQVMPSTSPVTATWGIGGSSPWAVMYVLFKPTAINTMGLLTILGAF